MCTDVDRNDKSRICEPGSVRVIGRRQIEMYSRLIHTVDHVEGTLRPDFDALDAFLCHAWAVTVTGAPKAWAMQFIEDTSARRAPGTAAPSGSSASTAISTRGSRCARSACRTASHRSASARRCSTTRIPKPRRRRRTSKRRRWWTRSAGGQCRARNAARIVREGGPRQAHPARRSPGLVRTHARQLSAPDRRQRGDVAERLPARRSRRARTRSRGALAGPGSPSDFDVSGTLAALRARGIPVFGVCLGCRASSNTSGASSACSTTRCTASRRGSRCGAARSSTVCRSASVPVATTRSTRCAARCPPSCASRRRRKTAW